MLVGRINLSPIFRPWALSFALAMLAGIVLLSVSRQTVNEFVASQFQIEQSHTVMTRLQHLSSVMERAEAARRAYSISYHERHLNSFYRATEDIHTDLDLLEKQISNELQQQKLAELAGKIDELLGVGKAYINAKTFDQAVAIETLAKTKVLIDQERALIGHMLTEEAKSLASYTQVSRSKLNSLRAWMLVTGLAFLAALGLAFFQSYREISRRQKAEQYLLKSQQQNIDEVHSLSLIGEMTSLLQACATTEESLDVVSRFVPRLIRADAGALYLFRDSRNLVERQVQWGMEPISEALFEPQDCWALRRGEPHLLDNNGQALACRHLHDHSKIFSLCIPIVA